MYTFERLRQVNRLHHSEHSYSKIFQQFISTSFNIVSCNMSNTFGHPRWMMWNDVERNLNMFKFLFNIRSTFLLISRTVEYVEYVWPSVTSTWFNNVVSVLRNLDYNKANGEEKISARLLTETASQIVPSLCVLCNKSLRTGVFPFDCKLANVVLIYKKVARNM